jgi:hypothetical protein
VYGYDYPRLYDFRATFVSGPQPEGSKGIVERCSLAGRTHFSPGRMRGAAGERQKYHRAFTLRRLRPQATFAWPSSTSSPARNCSHASRGGVLQTMYEQNWDFLWVVWL